MPLASTMPANCSRITGIYSAGARLSVRTYTSAPTSSSANAGSARSISPPAIELEDVVALAIEELGVEPLRED